MASKVNVRFVVLLSVVLGVVFASVAAMAALVLYKSAEELAGRAEKAAAEGDFKAATQLISKAVAKDRSNDEYLELWGEYLQQKVPETETEFRTDYQYYRDGVLRGLATVRTTDVDAHYDYLNEHFQSVRLGSTFNRQQWERLIELTQTSLRHFELEEQQSDDWHRLRRFRGISFAQIMSEGLPLEEGQEELAREDLELALEADPADALAAKSLALWHFVKAAKADELDQRERAEAARSEGLRVLAEAAEKNPNNPELAITRLRIEFMGRLRDVSEELPSDATPAERVAKLRPVTREFGAELERIADMMLSADTEKANVRTIDEYYAVGRMIDGQLADRTTREMLAGVIEQDPTNFDAMMALAGMLESNDDFEGALELRQRVTELPPRPVSLDGFRLFFAKRECFKKAAELALALAQRKAGEGEEYDEELLAEAREARDKLAAVVPDRHEALLFLDAKFAIADGDLNKAHELLVEYGRLTERPNLEHLRLLGDISMRADMPGSALDAYAQIVRLRPTDKTTRFKRAEVLVRLDKYEQAKEAYEEMLDYWPRDREVHQRLVYVRRLLGEEDVEIEDPVVECILDAQAVARGNAEELGDMNRAILMLDECIETLDFDARLYTTKARLMAAAGDVEPASSMLREVLTRHPDEQSLRDLLARLEASDDLESMLELVDREESSDELTKLVSKASVCNRFEAYDRADEFIRQAMEIDSTDARVVQLAFFQAVRRGDAEEVRRLERVAIEHNVDRAGGDIFRAHRQLMERDIEGAVESLKQGVAHGTAAANVWRLKGELEARLGRGADAAASFQEALRIDPRDRAAIIGYVSALRRLGRLDEALDVARANESIGRSDDEFVDLWLDLEAEVGDLGLAVGRREQWLDRNPENRSNRLKLAQLYIEEGRWSDARGTIDALREEEHDLRVAELEARFHSTRGDLAAAREAFESYIESIPEGERSADPYLAYGRFLIEHDRMQDGIAVLEQARDLSGGDATRIDLAIGDQLARRGRLEEALAAYNRVVENTSEEGEEPVVKRIIEVLVRLGRSAEAEQWMDRLGGQVETDLSLLLMRAEILSERGELDRARELLNRAAGEHGNNPTVYYRRARLNSSDPRFRADVMQDLATALELDPTYWPALRLRAAINFNQGQIEEAMVDLRTAVEANPRQDDLRNTLMNELIKRGRVGEAVAIADDALEARRGDYEVAIQVGDSFSSHNRWEYASRYYGVAWELRKDETVLERYAESLLNQDPPDLAGAEEALREANLDPEESAAVRLVRAKLLAKRDDMPGAMAELTAALDLLNPSREVMFAWFERVNNTIGSIGRDGITRYLAEVQSSRQDNPWIAFFLARELLGNTATRSQGIDALNQLGQHPDDEVRVLALQVRAMARYEDGDVEAAVEDMKAGLEIRPDDAELNNNLAYLLVNELGRVEESLPYAERAAAQNRFNVNVLDTLGYVYMELDRLEESEQILNRALRLADTPTERLTSLLRMARLRTKQAELLQAMDLLDQAQELIDQNPDLESYQENVDELRDEVR